MRRSRWSSQLAHSNVRGFSNSQAFHEVSTIDFAYMPQSELETLKQNEILRVPILPSNSTAAGRSDEAEDAVIRPEITTVSANGTHIDSPSAMSEVTDNHAAELSPFDLTNSKWSSLCFSLFPRLSDLCGAHVTGSRLSDRLLCNIQLALRLWFILPAMLTLNREQRSRMLLQRLLRRSREYRRRRSKSLACSMSSGLACWTICSERRACRKLES